MNRLLAQLGSDPAPFYSAESARMTRVQRNFVVIEYVEIAIIVMAAFMAVTQKGRPGTMGIALGLLCNAALLLSFDLVAKRRGTLYKRAIDEKPAGRPVAGVR